MQKEAKFYKKLKESIVQCELCPHFCTINPEGYGLCKARKNIDGKLYSMVYSKPVSVAVDPIEKKPLFHFLPGTKAYSVGTTGCNLSCDHCQNDSISQAFPEEQPSNQLLPEEVVENAISEGCESIAYTYTEPTIFFEYVYDIARIARKKKIKNITVTNGFINKGPAEELFRYIDAANVDLKAFTEEFYRKICSARLEPVLGTLKLLDKLNVWIEITNLIIPGLNDDMRCIKEMCEWIRVNLGVRYPLHFSRFYPQYKMLNKDVTPYETLKKAYDVAKKAGLEYVYIGNVAEKEYNHTYCPECNSMVIKRVQYMIEKNDIKRDKCGKCKTKIEGVWE